MLISHDLADKAIVQQGYGTLQLILEPNRRQSDKQVKYLSRGRGYTLLLSETEAVVALRSAARPSRLAVSWHRAQLGAR